MQVYVDLVMVLNFLVDLLLLLGTNRLAGFPPQIQRLLPAAALGGIYGGACMIPGFRFLGNVFWRLVSLTGMAVIAFGWNCSAWKRCGVFILLCMALGGIALSFARNSFLALLMGGAGVWLLCRMAFGETVGGREYVPVEIRYGDKCVQLIALRDSGNTLRDPITGQQVLIISADAAEKLTGLTEKQLHTPLETLAQRPIPGLRLVPYRAVGQTGGMLLAMGFEHVKIGSNRQRTLVAFAPEGLGRGEVYQALTGGMV